MESKYGVKIFGSKYTSKEGNCTNDFVLSFSADNRGEINNRLSSVIYDYAKSNSIVGQLILSTQIRYGKTIIFNYYHASIEKDAVNLKPLIEEFTLCIEEEQ